MATIIDPNQMYQVSGANILACIDQVNNYCAPPLLHNEAVHPAIPWNQIHAPLTRLCAMADLAFGFTTGSFGGGTATVSSVTPGPTPDSGGGNKGP